MPCAPAHQIPVNDNHLVDKLCTGMLYMCLGQDDNADFRAVLRDNPGDDAALHRAIDNAIARKPKEHNFELDEKTSRVAVARHMSMTGG